jgi:hypothetical protein
VIIANPGRKVMIEARFSQPQPPVPVLGSTAVGADMLCVAPAALAAALSPAPDIETANAGELHMNDTPLPIVDSGGIVAAPTKSLFQTETIALKMRWPVSWALRNAGAIAWLTPTWK